MDDVNSHVIRIITIAEGTDGAIYYTTKEGAFRRIRFLGTKPPVVSHLVASLQKGIVPLEVHFSVSVHDPDGSDLTYLWEFGTGDTSTSVSPVYTYSEPGTFTVLVRVSNSQYTTTSETMKITAGTLPVVTILSPADRSLFRGGQELIFLAEATHNGQAVKSADIHWHIDLEHGTGTDQHVHVVLTGATGSTLSFITPTRGHTFEFDVWYLVTAFVRMNELQGSHTIAVLPQEVILTFELIPASLPLPIIIDGSEYFGPSTSIEALIDFRFSIRLQPNTCHNNRIYEFYSWSTGHTRDFELVVPDTNTTYQAVYVSRNVYCRTEPGPGGRTVGFSLINTDTDRFIPGYAAIDCENDVSVNLFNVGTSNVTVRALTDPVVVGSVKFLLEGIVYSQQNNHPYDLDGVNG